MSEKTLPFVNKSPMGVDVDMRSQNSIQSDVTWPDGIGDFRFPHFTGPFRLI
jgi:hypothetical protein